MLRRWTVGVAALLFCAAGQAQSSYVGVGAALTNGVIPLFGIQVGGPVAEQLEVRGTLDSVFFVTDLGLDLLYTFPVSGTTLEGYIGGGPDVIPLFINSSELWLAVHATAGLEYLTGSVGIYGELQPLLPFFGVGATVFIKTRAGVNFYF